jgi:hypothetical protein
MTVREVERMPAGEFMEWTARLKDHPWGRHRTEQMYLQLIMYLAAGPSAKLLEQARLPWVKAKPDVREVSPDQMRSFLMSIGAKPAG